MLAKFLAVQSDTQIQVLWESTLSNMLMERCLRQTQMERYCYNQSCWNVYLIYENVANCSNWQEQMQWKIFTVYSNNYYNCTNYYHTIILIIYYVIIMIYCNVCKRSYGHKKRLQCGLENLVKCLKSTWFLDYVSKRPWNLCPTNFLIHEMIVLWRLQNIKCEKREGKCQ